MLEAIPRLRLARVQVLTSMGLSRPCKQRGVRSKVPSEVCHGSIRMAVVSDHEGRPIELIGSKSDTASPTHSL